MSKTYLVAGSSWMAEIDLENTDEIISDDNLKIEAASRAVEAHIGRRSDIPISIRPPIQLTKAQQEDEFHASLVHLLTDELEIGCGIGALMCIMDNQSSETHKDGEQHEWFISSKVILENVGLPRLVQKFNEKYPRKNEKRP